MKPPQSLQRYNTGGGLKKLQDAPDDALVSVGTVKSALAEIIQMIPSPGFGMSVRRGKDGDRWGLTGTLPVFAIDPGSGRIGPGTVGGFMPTLGGTRLDANPPPTLTLSGTFVVYFVLNFNISTAQSHLVGFSLTSVQIGTAGSLPSQTNSTKYIQLATVTNGRPSSSFFRSSFDVALFDSGPGSVGLFHSSA